jgi:hypothetical protein
MSPRISHTVDYTVMQQESKPISLRKKFRGVFSAKDKHSNRELRRASILSSLANTDCVYSADGVDSVSSGRIGGSSDVAMNVIETSLTVLQEGSALVANVPFIGPIASIILQALQMRGVRFRISLFV